MIERRLQQYQEINSNHDFSVNLFIDQVLSNPDKVSGIEIKSHFMDHFAGFDVMTLNISYGILMLAMHPEVQEKLYRELVDVLGRDYDFADKKLLANCEYLDQVTRENLRLFPVVPVVSRQVSENFEIEPGVEIPKDIILFINFFALQRNKIYWGEDANEFKPERFSQNRNPIAFIPFSNGPRICIAHKFSVEIFKVVLTRLVMSMKFKTTLKMADIELKSQFTLKMCGSHLVSVEKRL